jgi:HTH-type transcriptional regulator, glycine betaine synthesis regulator
MLSVDPTPPTTNNSLSPVERQVVDLFVDGVRVLGLPRSLGEIYGLLFISREPLALDDLVDQLQISKGSASQGLRTLKELGAVRESEGTGHSERRTYFEPALELKSMVGGFIREQIRPHLDSGHSKISLLLQSTADLPDSAHRQFTHERLERLDQWITKSSRVLPILQKLLGQ